MVKTTRAQREAIFRVFQRDFPSWITPTRRQQRAPCPTCGLTGGHQAAKAAIKVTSFQYRKFRKTVVPGPGCLMLPWRGMWLGIEPDGYTHS
jgi:hypothetical protein